MLKNRIAEIRNARGLSIEELAAKADMSPSYISRMSRGERNISLRNLEKLATALECSPEDLMGGELHVPTDIADIWAAIPVDRRELAKSVLESFVAKRVDENPSPKVKKGHK
jgi:transcriptional regulator with XRE-family HTH domain